MTGADLKRVRKQNGQTQMKAAIELGVSQTYLSLLEKGQRPVTRDLRKKAARIFRFSPLDIPFTTDLWNIRPATNEKLAADLAALKYPRFAHLKPGRLRNPAEVLIAALSARDLEARLVEALPWMVLKYAGLDWKALIMASKVRDVQNRLGFVVNLARRVAEGKEDKKTVAALAKKESELEGARLIKEDTLCRARMSESERKWLVDNRPEEARHWQLFTRLGPEAIDDDY
jgi:transcriptional regulator with XRE-family HTH domain